MSQNPNMTGPEYGTKKMSFELHPWPHSHVARLHYDVFHRQLDERLRDGDAGEFVVENVMASCQGELLLHRETWMKWKNGCEFSHSDATCF